MKSVILSSLAVLAMVSTAKAATVDQCAMFKCYFDVALSMNHAFDKNRAYANYLSSCEQVCANDSSCSDDDVMTGIAMAVDEALSEEQCRSTNTPFAPGQASDVRSCKVSVYSCDPVENQKEIQKYGPQN